ncbi:serine/threonine-protein kinase [Amycolatopsis sp. NPDC059021]|uniref:serine/threonine-protein kinase n=1 Tax=Amycolatopsis sp. NPDC059021 TaxID=3346704 RepID=UPI0036700E20
MGTVWSAYDEFLHRPVAVKEMKLPPGVPASQADELRERTLREARAIAVLSHPNVIILHDVARDNDEPFVVMELLPSRSLAHILRDHGPLTVAQAAAVGIAVASALEAAHAAGITHRDVKPGNVLVAGDGRIKLTDFGIARNVSEATMTRTGIMLGSPAYIAPEVASGGAVTPAADLWGLGATLFAAVEGTAPYDADGDPLETVGKVVNGKVPKPSPGQLADVISALMKKEPSKRISLREVRHRLYPLQTGSALDLFGPELFRTPDGKKTSAQPDATDTQIIKTVTPERPAEESGAALAADPGPLPFLRGAETPASASAALPPIPPPPATASASQPVVPQAPAPPPLAPPPIAAAPVAPPPVRRSAKASAVLALVSVLIFLIAAGGGFVLARTVGGQSLLPAAAGTPVSSGQPAVVPPPVLVTQQGNSNAVNGVKGGQFTLQVPDGWLKFVAPHRTPSNITTTVVQFVSPDGRQAIRVERLAGYLAYTGNSFADYVADLKKSYPGDTFYLAQEEDLPSGNGRALTYRTTERATARGTEPSGAITRSTFANLIVSHDDLWVLSLTAPSEQEDTARTDIFARVAPSLKITG